MAYTPYNQALPDTTLYERLQGNYTPIRGRANPYDVSLFNTDYYKDPFGYTKKKLSFGPTLDDTLGNKAAAVGLGGLFAPQASSGGDSSNQENQNNYYQDLEDRYTELNISEDGMSPAEARAAAQISVAKEQAARNERLAAGLTLFGNALIPGMGALGLAKYGPTGYADYLQGNTRVMMGDTSGYTSPTYTPKPAGVAAPVVSGQTNYNTYTPDSVFYSAPGYTSAGSDGGSLNNTPDSPTTGTGADVTYGDTSWGTYF